MLNTKLICESCGRDFGGDAEDSDIFAGAPCPSDDCPSRWEEKGKPYEPYPKTTKLSKKAAKAIVAARIQNSVYGFIIPMMSIPALYKLQEAAVAAGKSDADLKAIVAAFPGVEVSI